MKTNNTVSEVKAGFESIAAPEEEKKPMAPFKPLKKAPAKFPYDEFKLVAPEDARKISSTYEAMMSKAEQVKNNNTKIRRKIPPGKYRL